MITNVHVPSMNKNDRTPICQGLSTDNSSMGELRVMDITGVQCLVSEGWQQVVYCQP